MVANRILLQNFRNFPYKEIRVTENIVVIEGKNGRGKTNLLESLSLLQDGRGMKKAAFEEIAYLNNTDRPWTIFTEFCNGCCLSLHCEKDQKVLRINGKPSRSYPRDMFKVLWIGPQNDRLFSDSPDKRRKFFDAIFGIFFPQYKKEKQKYDGLLVERSKLLKTIAYDKKWAIIIETKIVHLGIQIQNMRYASIKTINQFLKQVTHLEPVTYDMIGRFDEVFECDDFSALYADKLFQNREKDTLFGGCSFGPHRSDIGASFGRQSTNIRLCSNGQQCMAILSLFIGLLYYYAENSACIHILLLIDEVVTHLDSDNRVLLFKELQKIIDEHNSISVQVWLTVSEQKIIAHAINKHDLINLN